MDTGTWTRRRGHGHGDMETGRHGYLEKEKRKPWRFSLTRLSFAHCANGGLKFDRLLTQKQTDVIRLQTD
jgi:hypothetical protein